MGDWADHLRVVSNFWCTIQLGESSYAGGFMDKHVRLPLRPAHVERWTDLFSAMVAERFEGPVATQALRRVGIMREVLLGKVRDGGGSGGG